MPISSRRKAVLNQLNLPDDTAMQIRIRTFLLQSGLSLTEFSELSGYNTGTLSRFMNGLYPTDTSELKASCKQVMDLHQIAEADRLDRPHYKTKGFQEVRTACLNALSNGSAYIVDGPPGTEKTESFRRIQHEVNQGKLGKCVYVYARINHPPRGFLSEICASAGVPNHGQIDQLIRKLRFFLGKGRTLLVIDEAQHLCHTGLEVLRQLLDLPPYFGVVLGGSHDLTTRLQHWQMEQWRSRLRKSILMTGPTDQECRAILRAELGELSDEECDQVIQDCRTTGERVELVRGRSQRKQYTYTSARDLFNAIEHVQQIHTLQPHAAQPVAPQREEAETAA